MQEDKVYEDLAAALHEGREPCVVPISMVVEWTDNFSQERIVGEGAFGKVYEGLLTSQATKNFRLQPLAVKQMLPGMMPEGGERHLKREIAVLRCVLNCTTWFAFLSCFQRGYSTSPDTHTSQTSLYLCLSYV